MWLSPSFNPWIARFWGTRLLLAQRELAFQPARCWASIPRSTTESAWSDLVGVVTISRYTIAPTPDHFISNTYTGWMDRENKQQTTNNKMSAHYLRPYNIYQYVLSLPLLCLYSTPPQFLPYRVVGPSCTGLGTSYRYVSVHKPASCLSLLWTEIFKSSLKEKYTLYILLHFLRLYRLPLFDLLGVT